MLIERIKGMPPEKIVEVEDFVEFLWRRSAARDQGSQEPDGPYPIRNHVGEEVLYKGAGRSLLVNMIDEAETSRQSAMGAQRI